MWWSTVTTEGWRFIQDHVAYKNIQEASKVLIILEGAKYQFQRGERIFFTLFQLFINFLKGNFKGNMLFQSSIQIQIKLIFVKWHGKKILINLSSLYLPVLYQAEESYYMRK